MISVPNVTLNDRVHIPQPGFGVFQIDPVDTKEATQTYGNEMQLGEALRAFEGESSEVLVTSKLNRCSTTPR